MNKSKLLYAMLLIFALSVSSFIYMTPAANAYDYPRIDDYYMVMAYPRTYALEKAMACEIDNFVGAIVVSDIETLMGDPYYWNIDMRPGFHMCYVGPNCRDYTPDSSGQWWQYHGRTPGFPLYPLNMSQFRMALEIIVAGFKDAWIAAIYGYINVRIDQVIPPANAYWFNPCISPYPSDWTIAESILTGAGFGWNYGPDSTPHTTDDIWTCPDGTVLWDGTRTTYPKSDRYAGTLDKGPPGSPPGGPARYGFWVMPPGTGLAPTSYDVTMRHAKKWNLFFCGVEDVRTAATEDHLLFIDDATDSYDELLAVPFDNRDHDIYFLCWGLGRNPDYLYDFFSPEVDVPGGDNSPGLDHPGLNRLLKTIKFWKVKDYEILATNVAPPCPPSVVVPACTTYGPFGPFDEPVTVMVEIEHVDLALGVYDEELTEGVHFTTNWVKDATGKWYVTIHIETDVTLLKGEALEAKFPFCTYHRLLTDIEEMREIVYLAQFKLYYLVPYLPVYSRNYINLYKPGVTGWVSSAGYGSEPTGSTLPWTTNNVWKEGGVYNYHLSGGVTTLNPIKVRWVYEAYPSGRLYDALYAIDPYTHADMPWVAYKWEIKEWIDWGLGVENGMIIKYYLRNDVTWQDGTPVTAQDIAWNFDFIESITAPEQMIIWEPLVKTEVVNDYAIELYVNATGLWKFHEMSGIALVYPETAWAAYKGDYNPSTTGDYTAAYSYKPWTVPHPSPPLDKPDLTMLYGTGPYWFRWWDPTIGKGVIKMTKNVNYWVSKALAESPAGLPGLLTSITTEEGSVYYTVQFTNLNPTTPLTFTYWGAFKDVGSTGPRVGISIALNPFQSVTFTYGPASPKRTGDLGGGTPARFFDYDNACEGRDLSLLLRVMKSTTTGEYIPQWWTIFINGALWRQR